MNNLPEQLAAHRRAARISQEELADSAGLTRMTIQRTEAGTVDPRWSSLLVMARALGLEFVLVPGELRPALEQFIHAGGKLLGQPPGAGAPASIAESLGTDPAAPIAGRSKAGKQG